MRIKKNVFRNLAIWMIGFGILVGLFFPFFSLMMGVPHDLALSFLFFGLCVLAGIIVGAVNILLAGTIVRKRMRRLSASMIKVRTHLIDMLDTGEGIVCDSSDCYLPVDTCDEFGESADAFNGLLHAFEQSLKTQNAYANHNKALTRQLQPDALCADSLHEMLAYMKACAGAIYVIKSGQLELAVCKGIQSPETLTDSPLILGTLKTKTHQIIDLPEDIAVDGLLTQMRPRCVILAPILFKDTPLGVIVLAALVPFPDHTVRNLSVFGSSLALALSNALEHSQLQTLVAIDPLTGIFNRRFGFERLADEFSSAIRIGSPIGVLLFDIDHFKKINDAHGHIAGDRVLVDICRMAKAMLRRHDILMRYGGEEFVAILPGASTHDTMVVADRLRELVERSLIPYGDIKIHATVSIGLVSYPEADVTDPQLLVKYADEAMYYAKQTGRNKVISYPETLLKH